MFVGRVPIADPLAGAPAAYAPRTFARYVPPPPPAPMPSYTAPPQQSIPAPPPVASRYTGGYGAGGPMPGAAAPHRRSPPRTRSPLSSSSSGSGSSPSAPSGGRYSSSAGDVSYAQASRAPAAPGGYRIASRSSEAAAGAAGSAPPRPRETDAALMGRYRTGTAPAGGYSTAAGYGGSGVGQGPVYGRVPRRAYSDLEMRDLDG
jgi:hypothetical protein